jgi:HD-GYP domain-containing protein (c-di-GMP phosphodiesterase class II)
VNAEMNIDEPVSRQEFALWVSRQRASLADSALAALAAAGRAVFPSPLLIRTLVGALSKSIATNSPAAVMQWAGAAGASYSQEAIGELVNAACDVLARLGDQQSATFAEILVSFEIIKAEVRKCGGLAAAYVPAEMPPASTESVSTRRTAMSTVLSMLRARDEATCAQAHATGTWCRLIATAMDIPEATAQRIVTAGLLHSIGKVATPDSVLLKNGELDAGEWEIMKQHAVAGADMLLEIPALAQYASIVRALHERPDGRGYPYGLSAEGVPFEARIVAVANAFQAMVSDRPHRKAMSQSEALIVLTQGRGTQWDASVVDAMVAVVVSERNRASDAALPFATHAVRTKKSSFVANQRIA